MKIKSKFSDKEYVIAGESNGHWKDLDGCLWAKHTYPIIYEEGDEVVVVKDWEDYPECFMTCVGRIGVIDKVTVDGYYVAFISSMDGWCYKHDEIAPYFGGGLPVAPTNAAVPVRKIRVLNP